MNKKCVYCDNNYANCEDHIIARQFFPNEQKYRMNLPKVPACLNCNTEKQKIEDGPAVLVQLAHPSEGSKKVLSERVPRTLEKNKRLRDSMKKGITWDFLSKKSRIISKTTFIEIDDRNWSDFYNWYIYLVKGFYYFITNKTVSNKKKIVLFRPHLQKEVDYYSTILRNTPDYNEFYFGNKEFHLLFAENVEDRIALASINFKDILVYGIVIEEGRDYSFLKLLNIRRWKI